MKSIRSKAGHWVHHDQLNLFLKEGLACGNNTLVALPPSLVLPITVKLSKIKNLLPEQHLLSIDLH